MTTITEETPSSVLKRTVEYHETLARTTLAEYEKYLQMAQTSLEKHKKHVKAAERHQAAINLLDSVSSDA